MKKTFIWITGIIFLLACQTLMPKESTAHKIPTPLSTLKIESTAQIFSPTKRPAAETPTFTASPTPTLAWIHQGPDAVTVPILLYHHIETSPVNSQYYVSPEKFEEQMELLHNWGYTTITLQMLLTSIYEGTDLPAHPLLISFDDGHASIYNTAFPIMQKYGFTGIAYIVGVYMGADKFINADQLNEMARAGWEIGSHSMSHKDLTALDSDQQIYEIFRSRELLSEKIGVPVNSFAYPFGFSGDDIFSLVQNAGYTSAMGLGYTHDQGLWNIFLLQRRDIKGTYDLKKFSSFLPWYGDPSFLPTDTPTPAHTPRPTKQP